MINLTLPDPIVGQWIWLSETNLNQESHQFYRRDFSIDEMPGKAEMWITARTAFHLFINGQHCASGPTANPGESSYVYCVNINYLLQVGNNQIAVQVFNANAPLTGFRKKHSGFWAQLQINDQPLVWSDENWKCLIADCYVYPGTIQALGAASVEIVDFRRFPHNWQQMDLGGGPQTASTDGERRRSIPKTIWYRPEIILNEEKGRKLLEPAPNPNDIIETCSWDKIPYTGSVRQIRQLLWLNFANLCKKSGPGIYIAETYLYSDKECQQSVECFCDRPYKFFLNDNLVAEQAVKPVPVHAPAQNRGDRRLSMDDYRPTTMELSLRKGWNRVMWAQDCASHGAGMTIVWVDTPNGSLQIRRQAMEKSSESWSQAGPLKTPLSLVRPNIEVERLNFQEFLLEDNPAWDISVALLAYNFSAQKQPPGRMTSESSFALMDKNFIVYDFGRTLYGFPHLQVTGAEGDSLEVICSEHCINGEVTPYCGGRRNASTLILSGKKDTWMPATPRGFRYIMILGSSLKGKAIVEAIHARIPNREITTHGEFTCSDKVLNNIWDAGSLTLSSTIRGNFIDAPCRDQAQYISDAMIQSWAACHLFGDFALTTSSLQTFARTQLETGELNSVSPSGLFQIIPDYSLLWIIWLRRHFMYTGDRKLLQELFPVVIKLLEYYDHLAVRHNGPLGDLSNLYGIRCFLDYDDIDREGICVGLNAIYCQALTSAARLAKENDQQVFADEFQRRAAMVASQIRELTWFEDQGVFVDSYHDAEMSKICSWQTNVLAIYGGIALPQHYDHIWNTFFMDEPPYERYNSGEYNNPYFKFFLLEVAFALGKTSWALRFIRYYWGKMLAAGAVTWWELFNPEGLDQNLRIISKCQGYGVAPNGFLISDLVGIRPSTPGMSRVVFNPCPQACSWVKATVPTPYGRINIEWKVKSGNTLEANISANYPLEVIPILDPAMAESAEFKISEEITILTPVDDNDNHHQNGDT
jgi:hypothetical protein